jgi:hypothetical protein
MTTVWVVEEGEYSDYRVVGVFTSQANAQQIADAINGGAAKYAKATVAEWALDPAIEAPGKAHAVAGGYARRWNRGTVRALGDQRVRASGLCANVAPTAPAFRGNPDKPDILQALIWAKDDTHAVKITNEHRARMIASGEWDADTP